MLNDAPETTPADDDHQSLAATPQPRRRGRGQDKGPRIRADVAGAPRTRRVGLRYLEAQLSWTPMSERSRFPATAGQVKVGPWPDRTGWSDAFACHGGGAEVTDHLPTKAMVKAMVLRDFNTLVLRDGMRPRVVHEAFLALSDYRQTIDPAIPGASQGAGRPRESNAATRDW